MSLCTSCSKPVIPVVAIDIDGTLGKYHEHFHAFAQEYLNKSLRPGYDGSVEFHDWLGVELSQYREMKLAYRQGGGKRTMPAHPGVGALFSRLNDLDCEIWLTTTRPYLRLDSTDPDTRFWLERNGVTYDHLLYDEDKYHKLFKYVETDRVVGILDDLPGQLSEASMLFGDYVPIMIDRQSNKAHRAVVMTHVGTLTEAGAMLAGRIERWHQTHARDLH